MKTMEVLTFLTREKEFSEFFRNEGINLFLQIVLPFLKISEVEREMLAGDSREFCNLIEDVCGD